MEQLRRVPKPGDSSLMTHSAFRGFKAAFHHSKPRIACRCFHFEGEKNSENLREELVLPGWSFQSQEMASSSNKKLPQPEEGSGLEAQTSSDESRFQPSLHGLKIQKDMKDIKDMKDNMEKHVM